MEYIFILISTGFGLTKGFCSKKLSGKIVSFRDNLDINLFRNIICCLFSLIPLLFMKDLSFDFSMKEIIICAFSGIAMSVFISSWMFAIKGDSYMLVSACASSSFIVPALFGIFLFDEKLTLNKGIAFLITATAIFFLLRYNTHLNGKITFKSVLLLATVLLSQGVTQSMQKFYTYSFPEKSVGYYIFYSTVFTVLSLAIMILFSKREKEAKPIMKGNVIIYAAVMALALFGNTYFQALAAKTIDAIILYPVSSALSLGGAAAMSSVFFGEKMNRDSVIGIILVLIAMILSK